MDEILPAPEEVPCGTHLFGIHVGQGEHAAAKQGCDLVGVDTVVLGLSSVNRFHVQGVTEDEGNVSLFAEVGDPIPGEDALDADDHIGTEAGDDKNEMFRFRGHVSVEQDLALLIQDADVHLSYLQVDPAIELVVVDIESYEGSSLCGYIHCGSLPYFLGGSLHEFRRFQLDS